MSSLCLLSVQSLCLNLGEERRLGPLDLQIYSHAHIALIGPNGAGKSTLLRALRQCSDRLRVGYLEQDLSWNADQSVWEAAGGSELAKLQRFEELDPKSPDYAPLLDHLVDQDSFLLPQRLEDLLSRYELIEARDRPVATLSGGERMRLGWVRMLAQAPELLLLDEPTNHLDQRQRAALLQLLDDWKGAAIVVSHDVDFLRHWPKTLWSLEYGQLRSFSGSYEELLEQQAHEEATEHAEWEALLRKRRKLGLSVAQEEMRRARTVKQGLKKYDRDKMKANLENERAEFTMGRKIKKRVHEEREDVREEIAKRRKSRLPTPRFHFDASRAPAQLMLSQASVGFADMTLLSEIELRLQAGDCLRIRGDNGSGKSTLLRALNGDPSLVRGGSWELPDPARTAFLDQHYGLLDRDATVLEMLSRSRPDWSLDQLRHQLGAFLFVHHASLEKKVAVLSEGEKARLCLALLSASSPDLLILDELCNNLDLGCKQHIAAVLRKYPGILVLVSHEDAFVEVIRDDVLTLDL